MYRIRGPGAWVEVRTSTTEYVRGFCNLGGDQGCVPRDGIAACMSAKLEGAKLYGMCCPVQLSCSRPGLLGVHYPVVLSILV